MFEHAPAADQITQALVDASPDGLLAFDRECRYTAWNAAMERISGVARAEAVGRVAFDLFPFLRETGEDEYFRRALAGETVTSRERRFDIPETGRGGFFEGHYRPLRDAAGRVAGGLAVIRDVTERRAAEDALRESEERYRSFIANSSEGVWRFEAAPPVPVSLPADEQIELFYERARLAECNDAAARMYGYERGEEMTGARLSDLLVRDDPQNVEYLRAFVLSGYRLTDVESVEQDREGRRKFIANSLVGVVEDGLLARVWGTQRDVSEARAADESLKLYGRVLESMREGVSVSDERGFILYTNPAEEEMFGYGRGELVGQHVTVQNAYPPEENERIVGEVIAQLKERGVWTGEWSNRRKDGTQFTTYARITALETGGRRHWVCVQEDMTERRRAERALRESESRYQRAAESGRVGVWDLDLGTEELYLSPNLKALLGYADDDIPNNLEAWCALVHPEDKEPTIAATRDHVEGRTPRYQTEVRRRHKDGRYLWFLAQGVALRDAEGRAYRLTGSDTDITERKLVEEELRRSEERYRGLLENANDIIYSHDLQGNYLSINRAGAEITGYTRAEILGGLNIARVVAPEHLRRAREMLERKLRDPSPTVYELDIVTRDGRRLTLEVSTRISYRDGVPAAVEGVARDVTERKRAEEERARRQAKERFLAEAKNALSASLDYETTLANVARVAVPHFADWCAVDMLDEGGTLRRLAVAHVDPRRVEWAHEMHRRYPPDPDAPRGFYQVLRTGRPEFYPEVTDAVLAEGARDAEHLRLMREVGFRSVMLVPLGIRGEALGVLTFVNSDSGRAHTEEDLSLAEDLARRASLAVDNARLYRAERQTRVAAERAADRLARLQAVSNALSHALTAEDVATAVVEHGVLSLGAHAGTVVALDEAGATLELIAAVGFPSELAERWRRFSLDLPVPLADAVRGGAAVFVHSFDEAAGRYPSLASMTPVTGSRALAAVPLVVKGRTVGGMGLSFTEPQEFGEEDRAFALALAQQCAQALDRARLYETERRLRAAAEDASRLKDEFLATVSHELRTPLTAIVGWSSMLRSSHFDAEETRRALEVIERNAKSQARIVDDILDVSRIITGKLRLEAREVDLSAVAAAALESVRPAAETRGIRLEEEIEGAAGTVWGDPARLQQVLWNLLSNAVKFTPEGGSVTVRLGGGDGRVRVEVADTGQGIEPEFLPYVFDRFRQADGKSTRAHGGLGLGLSIVRHLVDLHGGTVRAESEGLGRGATFTVELPRASARGEGDGNARASRATDGAGGDETPADSEAAALSGVRVLIVEDEADARELIAAAVARRGADVLTVASAAEALDAFGAFRPDVLVSDIGMPGEDGYSLMRRLRAQGAAVPAVALTAYAREEDRARALAAGYQVHVAKPVNPAELAALVGQLARVAERE